MLPTAFRPVLRQVPPSGTDFPATVRKVNLPGIVFPVHSTSLSGMAFERNGQQEISMDPAMPGNRAPQVAARRNRACFPSQAPVFGQRPR